MSVDGMPAKAQDAEPAPEIGSAQAPVATAVAEPDAGAVTAPPPPPAPAQPSPPAPAPRPSPTPSAVAAPEQVPTALFSIEGRLSLEGSRGSDVRVEEVAETVVYFVPLGNTGKVVPQRREVVTRNKRFHPSTLVVPVGSSVAFPNQDTVLHNVFSLTPGAVFDLGLYGAGESREIRLDRPTVVRVHCNVHHSMQTDVVVVNTPHFTQASEDGRFRLDGLPSGRGTLHLWHPRVEPVSRQLNLPLDGPLSLALVAVKPRVPPHSNKEGAPYRAALER